MLNINKFTRTFWTVLQDTVVHYITTFNGDVEMTMMSYCV